jgi:succinate dehydrogenase/fumarate reductase flavoprotein subunit
LTLLKRQILEERNHPIMVICNIFREEFSKAYKKYVKPKKNEKGVEDKVNIIQMFREKTKQLQVIRKSQLDEDSNSETLAT